MNRHRKGRALLAAIIAVPVIFSVASLFAVDAVPAAGRNSSDPEFSCGGRLEADTWALWDRDVRHVFQKEHLHDRLDQGDIYALYDLQLYSQSLWSMARHCDRTERLREAADFVTAAYRRLESSPASGRAWICRGGSICEEHDLVDKEVKLVSVQFLGFAAFIANALARTGQDLAENDAAFIAETRKVLDEHLIRWSSDEELGRLRKVRKASPADVRDGDSFLLFSDQDLWQLTIYAELAGVLQRLEPDAGKRRALNARARAHLLALLQAFDARLTVQPTVRDGHASELADLDRGYWARMPANRYAGYDGAVQPVRCTSAAERVRAVAAPPRRSDTGWDLSHARRLVQALDAFERNRQAMQTVYSLPESRLPRPGLTVAFGATLLDRIWNGDMVQPLFANYWSGANGWFGAGDDGDGGCSEGMAPYAMTDSFPTGGYIVWARKQPQIGVLGRRLYDLVRSNEPDDEAFIERYYPTLAKSTSAYYRSLHMTMFYASLVEAQR